MASRNNKITGAECKEEEAEVATTAEALEEASTTEVMTEEEEVVMGLTKVLTGIKTTRDLRTIKLLNASFLNNVSSYILDRNFTIDGTCKYGDSCSFAHGD